LKKPTGLVRFHFYKPKTKKTELNKKTSKKAELNRDKTESNQFEPVFILKNRTKPKPVGLKRFQFRFFLNSVWLLFLIKIEQNKK